MSSIAVKLPLRYDSQGGYQMIRSLAAAAQQNLKMLLLTNPGERVMIPSYGVGLKRYLFENFRSGVEADISAKIHQQVRIYMPYIRVGNIAFDTTQADRGKMQITLHYSIPQLGLTSAMDLSI